MAARAHYFCIVLLPFYSDDKVEAGCDEAGRGCIAGPVTAAAVIMPRDYFSDLLNDSKQLTRKQRDLLRTEIEREAVDYKVAHVSPEEIDDINILNASYLAMHRCIERLNPRPSLLLIDGNRFNEYDSIEHKCIIKGDGKYYSIAAASVLAKTYRDELMEKLDGKYPLYHWRTNVGYPTPQHRDAIREAGITPHHRKTFQLLPAQLELFD